MVEEIPSKIKGFLKKPVPSFREFGSDEFHDSFIYFLVIHVFYTIMSTLTGGLVPLYLIGPFLANLGFSGAAESPGTETIVFVSLWMMIGGVAWALLFPIWYHLWIRVFGGKNGLDYTYNAYFYAETPVKLFGWIPIAGIVFVIWSYILKIIGFRELHGISVWRSITAVLLSVLIPAIIVSILIPGLSIPALLYALYSAH